VFTAKGTRTYFEFFKEVKLFERFVCSMDPTCTLSVLKITMLNLFLELLNLGYDLSQADLICILHQPENRPDKTPQAHPVPGSLVLMSDL
jgi:hypothetical protein